MASSQHNSNARAERQLPLGRQVEYVEVYTPSLLHSMPRSESRQAAGISAVPPPFVGEDLWTAYELSWLDNRGRPRVAALRLTVPAHSPAIVESKSMKLYLNSFAQTRFANAADVLKTLNGDLALAFQAPILVELVSGNQLANFAESLPGQCLDELDVEIVDYVRNPDLLAIEDQSLEIKETLHTQVFRSLCPVTGQPDWAALVVQYSGPPIIRESLFRYLVSYRSHSGFHEATVEQIFMDLLERCGCQRLSVWARFMRRGGIDINPHRSNWDPSAPLIRLPQQ